MITAFQSNAFQNNAFQIAGTPVIVVDDGHDGDRMRRRHESEWKKRDLKKADIIRAYERLVEGRVDEAEEIVEPFIRASQKAKPQPTINFDRLMSNLNAAERLWQAYLDMDDEEVLLLL